MRAYKEELKAMSVEPWVEVDLMTERVKYEDSVQGKGGEEGISLKSTEHQEVKKAKGIPKLSSCPSHRKVRVRFISLTYDRNKIIL